MKTSMKNCRNMYSWTSWTELTYLVNVFIRYEGKGNVCFPLILEKKVTTF